MTDRLEKPGTLPLAVLRALPLPLVVFDGADRLVMANPAAWNALGLTPDSPTPLRTAADFARLLAYRGVYGHGDPEEQVSSALAVDRRQPRRRTIRSGSGRWYDIVYEPLPDGGWMAVLLDVTQHRRALEASHAWEKLAGQALRHHPSGLGVFDAGQCLRLFNGSYEQLLQLPPGTLRLGMGFAEVFDLMALHQGLEPEQAARLRQERLSADRSRPRTHVRLRADGAAIRSISQPLPDGGFLVLLQDVTELQQARDEAARRATTLNGVLAALPHGVCVFGADHRLSLVNQAYQRMMRGAEIHPGEHMDEIIRRRIAAGEYPPEMTHEVVAGINLDFENAGGGTERARPDGTVIRAYAAPLPDGGFISVISDVTALRQAEEAARHRALLLQAMLDSLRHGVCLFDSEDRVVAANALAAGMIGLRPEEMAPGTPLGVLRRLQHERGEFGAGAAGERVFAERAARAVSRRERYTRVRPDGMVVEITSDPTPDGGHVRTYMDVTEEYRARAAIEAARAMAEEADAAKSRFLATMSHELRTPLNAVIGFSEALLAEPDGPNVAEFAGTILEAGRHLLSLIDEVLAVAKTGPGAPLAQTRPLHLPSVLEGAARLMRKAAETAGVALAVEPLPALPRVMADEQRLRQVLLNLLSNAVKFTPQGGEVRLAADPVDGGGVEVRVTDNGIGIAPGQVERAFEPFVQLETSHARRYAGSGLGLYLARALAQSMGGALALESVRGQGTVARLRLEAVAQQQEQTA